MLKKLKFVAVPMALMSITATSSFALTAGSHLVATQAITGLSGEVSGPLAYGLSLIAIVGTAVSWYRHHHDMGALAQGGMGALFIAGVALGGSSLLGFIPGVAGVLI